MKQNLSRTFIYLTFLKKIKIKSISIFIIPNITFIVKQLQCNLLNVKIYMYKVNITTCLKILPNCAISQYSKTCINPHATFKYVAYLLTGLDIVKGVGTPKALILCCIVGEGLWGPKLSGVPDLLGSRPLGRGCGLLRG